VLGELEDIAIETVCHPVGPYLRWHVETKTAIGGPDAIEMNETLPHPSEITLVCSLVLRRIAEGIDIGEIGDDYGDAVGGKRCQGVQIIPLEDLVEERFQRLRHLLDGSSRCGVHGLRDSNGQCLPLLLVLDLYSGITQGVTLEELSHMVEDV